MKRLYSKVYEQLRAEGCPSGSVVINVMIRPRGGNFVYTPIEAGYMRASINVFNDLHADGFVFGCLDKNNCQSLISYNLTSSNTSH